MTTLSNSRTSICRVGDQSASRQGVRAQQIQLAAMQRRWTRQSHSPPVSDRCQSRAGDEGIWPTIDSIQRRAATTCGSTGVRPSISLSTRVSTYTSSQPDIGRIGSSGQVYLRRSGRTSARTVSAGQSDQSQRSTPLATRGGTASNAPRVSLSLSTSDLVIGELWRPDFSRYCQNMESLRVTPSVSILSCKTEIIIHFDDQRYK